MGVRTSGKNGLENEHGESKMPALPHERTSSHQGFTPAAVHAALCRVCAAEPESLGLAREIRSDREAESLAAWADDRGLLSGRSRPAQNDELTGGEHCVEIYDKVSLVFKSTHPGKFGYAADVEMVHPKGRNAHPRITAGLVDATPLEYLFRLAKQNELFGDDIRVMGAVRYRQGLAVLTTQPFYSGRRTEQSVIDDWFHERGWRTLPGKSGAFYEPALDLLIMDALPRNVLTVVDGSLMPFDVVVVQPSELLKSRLCL
jgi:hypothetical protein